jgi:hypothetical protein
VVLILFTFSLVAFFFIILMIIVVVVVVVVVVVFIVAIILRQLLSFFHCFLIFFSRKYHHHDLKGILLLRNVLRRIGLRLRLRWHIPWRHQTSGLTSSALVGCAATTNHLKFGNRREQDNSLNKINEIKTRMKLKLRKIVL